MDKAVEGYSSRHRVKAPTRRQAPRKGKPSLAVAAKKLQEGKIDREEFEQIYRAWSMEGL
jgi:hypothetical protein